MPSFLVKASTQFFINYILLEERNKGIWLKKIKCYRRLSNENLVSYLRSSLDVTTVRSVFCVLHGVACAHTFTLLCHVIYLSYT